MSTVAVSQVQSAPVQPSGTGSPRGEGGGEGASAALAGVTAAFQGGSGGAAPVAKVTVADQAQPTHDDVRRTVAAVNQRLQQNNVALQFSRDDVNGQTVISVVDRETHQIITQIPSQTVIELNRQLEKITRGHLVQENV